MIGTEKHAIADIFTSSPILRDFVKKVEQLAKLNRSVLKQLEPELAKHCRVANLREGVLVITTPSPTTGHLLRFSKTELLSKLRTEPEWCGLKSIETHVQPSLYGHEPQIQVTPLPFHGRGCPEGAGEGKKTLKKPTLSETSASIIRATADGLTSGALQEALLRLLRHEVSVTPHSSLDSNR